MKTMEMLKKLTENKDLKAKYITTNGNITVSIINNNLVINHIKNTYHHTMACNGFVSTIFNEFNIVLNINDEWEIIYPEIDIYKALDELILNNNTIQSVVSNKKYHHVSKSGVLFENSLSSITQSEYNGKWRVVK